MDTFVELEDRVIGIELKAPKWIPLKAFIPEDKLQGNLLIDENQEYVKVNDIYVLQAKIQRYLLEKMYPDKKVEEYIFLKGMAEFKRWRKKLYIVYPVYESVTEEDLKELVMKFKEAKGPRSPTECESYCEYYRRGLCEGKEFSFGETKDLSEADEEVRELLKEYRTLEGELKNIESQLKRKLKGCIKIGSKEIGWVEKEVTVLDEEKIIQLLDVHELPEYFQLNWRKKKELIERFGRDIIKEERRERVWKL